MDTPERGEGYARRVHEETQRFVQDLLAQNERLRGLVGSLQADKERLSMKVAAIENVIAQNEDLRARVSWLESQETRLQRQLHAARLELQRHLEEQARLEHEIADVESRGRRFSEQYLEVDRHGSNLVRLCAASDRLHSTLDRREVLEIIQGIVGEIVGSEAVAIYERQEDTLRLVASSGVDPTPSPAIAMGSGPIGGAAARGEIDVAPRENVAAPPAVAACVPLVLAGTVTGAIAVFHLPRGQPALESLDREILALVARHAAMALHASALNARLAGELERAS
jgi:chaperonin cofactor prefoldin